MIQYVSVAGTWALKEESNPEAWWHPHSPFAQVVMAPAGWTPLRDEPFVWSTDANGVQGWRRWFGPILPDRWKTGDTHDWYAGGAALSYFARMSAKARAEGHLFGVLAHSHGGQLVAYAAARGLRIDHLITVATPVRTDVPWSAARPHIGHWLHLHAKERDKTQWWGSFGDGSVGTQGDMPLAEENREVPGMGHSELLRDPAKWPLWHTQGWLVTA